MEKQLLQIPSTQLQQKFRCYNFTANAVIYHAFSHLQLRQIHITQLLQSTAVKDTQLPQIQSCYRCTAATDTQLIQIHSCYRYPTDTDSQLLQIPSCYRYTAATDTYVAATEHSCYRYTATDAHLPQIHSSYRYSTQLQHIHTYTAIGEEVVK